MIDGQKHYSLAIQALHERREMLIKMNDGLVEQGQFAQSIQECQEAIEFLETNKEINRWLNNFDCPHSLWIDKRCGDEHD